MAVFAPKIASLLSILILIKVVWLLGIKNTSVRGPPRCETHVSTPLLR